MAWLVQAIDAGIVLHQVARTRRAMTVEKYVNPNGGLTSGHELNVTLSANRRRPIPGGGIRL
jgi:hypothetical protein